MGLHKNNLIIYILCVLMFGALPLQADVDVPYDSSGFHYGKFLEKQKKYKKALRHYQKNIGGKEVQVDEVPKLMDVSDGDYRDRQSFYLKRMAHLMRHKVTSELMGYRAQYFFNENLKTYTSPREREKIIKKAYVHLPTKIGFQIFNLLGARSVEEGDCVKAVYLWENAKENSSGYASLDNKDKGRFLTKLGRCYKNLGFRDKLRALLKEMSELSKMEANQEEKKLFKDFEFAKKALKEFHSFLSSCPTLKNNPQSLNKQFTITKKKEEVIKNVFVENTKLCFKGKKSWCIEESEFAFLSEPLILGNYVYIVGKDVKKNDLFLLTIDKNRGKVLKKTYFGTIRGTGVLFGDKFYPYKLYIKNGKIQLTTESTHNEFYLNGSLAHVIDLKHPKNQNLGIITAEALTFTLLDSDLKDVRQVIQKIQKLGGSLEGAVRFLAQGLASWDEMVAGRAALALGEMGEKAVSAIPALTTALKHKNSWVPPRAVEALGKMGEKAIPALTTALKHNDWDVRRRVVEALEKMGEKAIPVLTTALRNNDWGIRHRAVWVLGKMGEKAVSAIPALTHALDDKVLNVRHGAAEALGKMGEKAIPALTTALKHKALNVRRSAAEALGRMGEKAVSAIPAFTHALRDNDGGVRDLAVWALGKMGEKAIPALITVLKDKGSNVRSRAAEALGRMGEKAVSAIPVLTTALRDNDMGVRNLAAWALGQVGEKAVSAIPALTKLLEDEDSDAYFSAKQALEKIRGKK